ncbi:hypothetical protein D7Z96_15095 [Pseudarthrobacter phenanthrenivorans]|uniref:Uncharacterized protein n=1 Tax=Pseudarthrobacter phenanthrenivorans TaxID=361575 RepID=A0A3B0FPG1_PSEPS|nr:hypothetical protein [Pseudarthrobacter phenanthrenivorans]RKO21789.1 hypothetical protein D7Z96_15095 [Pseudarthrobacter phenanthrenivorans]
MPLTVLPQRAAPTQTSGLWQFLRAGVVTALVVGIAAAAHQGAGGHLPPVAVMAMLTAVVMAPVTALSRRRLSLPILAGILAVGQGVLHVAFNALSGAGPHCGPAGVAAHGHHQDMVVPGCAVAAPAAVSEAVSSGFSPTVMTVAHVLATALTVLVLARAEAALWQLKDWLRPLTRTLRPAVLPPVITIRATRAVSRPRPAPGTRITPPRGPPSSPVLLPVLSRSRHGTRDHTLYLLPDLMGPRQS